MPSPHALLLLLRVRVQLGLADADDVIATAVDATRRLADGAGAGDARDDAVAEEEEEADM